jgi:hypothetical protein
MAEQLTESTLGYRAAKKQYGENYTRKQHRQNQRDYAEANDMHVWDVKAQGLEQNFQNTKFGQFMGKANSALGSGVGQSVMGGVGKALDMAKGLVKTQAEKGKNPTGYETQQAIGDTLTKVPIPIVQAAGLAYKGISMLAEATGGNTNSITKEQAEDLGISKGTRLANNIIGALHPGAG